MENRMRSRGLVAAFFLIFLLADGCQSSVMPPLSNTEANTMVATALQAVAYETGYAKGKSLVTNNISYANPEGTLQMTGAYSYNAVTTYPIDYRLACTFSNYKPLTGNIARIDGTVFLNTDMTAIDQMSNTYNGVLTILYKGTSYISEWNFGTSFTAINMICKGSFTVNGYSYAYAQ
jgi:hypothetical protein